MNIRYKQCCGSGMFIPDPGFDFFPSRIPDPNCLHPGSRILIKEFKYFNPPKKWFLSSNKYDPGCLSRIPDPDADFLPSRIPDPGSKRYPIPEPGSGSATLHLCTGTGNIPIFNIMVVFRCSLIGSSVGYLDVLVFYEGGFRQDGQPRAREETHGRPQVRSGNFFNKNVFNKKFCHH